MANVRQIIAKEKGAGILFRPGGVARSGPHDRKRIPTPFGQGRAEGGRRLLDGLRRKGRWS